MASPEKAELGLVEQSPDESVPLVEVVEVPEAPLTVVGVKPVSDGLPVPRDRTIDSHDARWTTDPKKHKFVKFTEMISLNVVFGHLGRLIALFPMAFVISALIMSCLSLGMFKMHLRDRVRDGYTPTTSPSRYETDVLRKFFNLNSDPVITVAVFLPKDNGSMHRPEFLVEALRIHKHIKEHVNVTTKANATFTFNHFCGDFCDSAFFFEWLASEFEKPLIGENISMTLNYPISKMHGFDMHLERNFFGVRTVESIAAGNDTIDKVWAAQMQSNPNVRAVEKASNIRWIDLVQIMYNGQTMPGFDEESLAEWEMALYRYVRNEFKSDLIELQVLGSEIVDYEMNKDSQLMGPFITLGFVTMIAFAMITSLMSSFYYDAFSRWSVIIGPIAAIGSLLAVFVTFGIYGIAGMRINSVMLIMPFLTLGIGVNDSFIMAHCFMRHVRHTPSKSAIMEMVFSEIGPSITITTLTNVVTFIIGAMVPTAEIQLFCFAAAIALGYSYIFTLIVTGPLLVFLYNKIKASIDAPTEGKERCAKSLRIQFENIATKFVHAYSRLFCSWAFHVLNTVVYLTMLGFAIYGVINITARLDTEKILPRNSLIRRPHEIIAHQVWSEYYPLTVFMTKPFDLANERQFENFESLMRDLYAMDSCKGKNYTTSWIDDYKKYFNDNQNEYDFDFYSDDGISKDLGPLPKTGYDLRYFKNFLNNYAYKHYKSIIRYHKTSDDWRSIVIDQSMFNVVYEGLYTWQDRIDIMVRWRSIANRYPDLGIVMYEANAMFVDQMLSLKAVSIQSGLYTLACMFVVCVIFIQHPLGIASAVLSIGSIAINVIGFLYFWKLDLDPASLGAILMSVGLSVDFTAHPIYAYLHKSRSTYQNGRMVTIPLTSERERVENCINSVLYPMFQGGFSTALCVMPLLCIPDYIPLVFFKTVVLVVIFGLYHGLVVLPGFLILFTKPAENLHAAIKARFSTPENATNAIKDSEDRTPMVNATLKNLEASVL
uniref:SSD domain-containing protein n=1 Tax=Panagrellus redivivus TaxID=6233 RepID=A0A7E4V2R9_PANRE